MDSLRFKTAPQAETEAAPIRHAELIGADTDSERAVPRLIALMVVCCDPLAIALVERWLIGHRCFSSVSAPCGWR
jgi:hypothetical protein